jgi:hypothetical protein
MMAVSRVMTHLARGRGDQAVERVSRERRSSVANICPGVRSNGWNARMLNRPSSLLDQVAEQIFFNLWRADFPHTTIDEEVMNIDEGQENHGTKR